MNWLVLLGHPGVTSGMAGCRSLIDVIPPSFPADSMAVVKSKGSGARLPRFQSYSSGDLGQVTFLCLRVLVYVKWGW